MAASRKAKETIKFVASAATAQAAIQSDFHFRTRRSKPLQVLIEPTVRCPMACKFCDLPTDRTYPRKNELPISRWMEIVDELRAYLPAFKTVYIGGGEPFFRKDLIELIEYSHSIEVGTRTLTIGYFCNHALLDRLLASPMHSLKFSLHSSREDVHNRLVGRDVFRRATGAIKYLRSNGYTAPLGMLCTAYAENADHLDEVARFGADLGLDYIFFRPLFPQTVADRKFDLGLQKPDECMVQDIDTLRGSIERLKALKQQGLPIADSDEQLDAIPEMANGTFIGKTGCHMMYESIHIKPDGSIDACGHMALGVLGNVANQPVAEVLSSDQAWNVRHSVSRKCNCLGNIFVRRSVLSKASMVFDMLK